MCVSSGVGQARTVRVEVDESIDVCSRLREIYDTEFVSLVRLAQLLVGERGLAEELVQDSFARLLERPPRLIEADKLAAYVRSTVLNATRSKLRRRKLERKHARNQRAEHEDQGTQLPDLELRSALLQLPMRQRQCVALRYYDDRTVDDIAQLLDVTPGSVKTHLHRGLARLRELLGGST